MQSKDIPEKEILTFLHERAKAGQSWATLHNGFENSISQAMPAHTPEKVKVEKMKKLIKQGLVSGCACGCRGDFEITEKGSALIEGPKQTNQTLLI